MQFDLVVPTRGDLKVLSPLLTSLNTQTLLPERIFLVFNAYKTEEQWEEFNKNIADVVHVTIIDKIQAVSCGEADETPVGASQARNYGISLVKSPYVYMIDDDNILDEDFFEKSVKEYQHNSHHDTLLYSPTVGWRQTDHVQSVGIRKFHYWLGWAEPMLGGWKAKLFGTLIHPFAKKLEDEQFYYPRMIGGNSLLGKTVHFKELLFDERMPFIYEDIDLTHRWYRMVGPIAVSKSNIIHHMERDKTKLEQSFIATSDGVYQKMKNASIFVANNATFGQRVQFLISGLRVSTLWFSLFILVYGKKKGQLLRALARGVNAGAKAFSAKPVR